MQKRKYLVILEDCLNTDKELTVDVMNDIVSSDGLYVLSIEEIVVREES